VEMGSLNPQDSPLHPTQVVAQSDGVSAH